MSELDIGCGFGDTTIEIARRVGPNGSVTGIDAALRFIELATLEARALGVENARFVSGDVQTDELGGPFDRAYSRFGTMFFASPVAAFRNVRRALVPGSAQLLKAGFERPTFERFDADISIGQTVDEAVELGMEVGPAGEILRLAGADAVRYRADVIRTLRELSTLWETPEGVRGRSSSWIVSVYAPRDNGN